ncbi:FtsW/RodA/SpoVE family cell cycle protein [Sporolactobacillus spathodeae]|uniref:Probable peptidoglycan glycosyltransferase FtsW n=1 Tax=Sporolactobacillus spathodeae TaxID=1465502 RepID=A0ABS2Q4S1_9BACL|nr:FtsW/RodA/SpoVE family cell cycle protein [Sporolactobacillus spathodeae]MBM7656766.1 cell division protein FtsW [Sporolactobacillus spathodeae]
MIKKMFRYYDYSLLVTTLLLIGTGLIMVYSAGSVWASMVMRPPHPTYYFFIKQLFWFALALPFGIFGMIVPYKMYHKVVKPMVIGSILLLAVLFFAGSVRNNAQSWLSFGGFNLQPAELVKVSLIFYLASAFAHKQNRMEKVKTVFPPLAIIFLIFILVAKQPDLGTAMILIAISGIMVLCSGLTLKHLLLLFGGGLTGVLGYFAMAISHVQSGRFTAAYDPFAVAQSTGRQLINSYIAIASGGLFGKGLGHSIEKTGFLPEPQTDFIIAIVGEELGLIGILFIILCLAYLIFRGYVTAIRCKDAFGSLLAIGISSMIAIQTFVNLGAATGLIPVTGVTLPFISYGGSSLIVLVFSIGVLLNISSMVNMKRSSSKQEGNRENVETFH